MGKVTSSRSHGVKHTNGITEDVKPALYFCLQPYNPKHSGSQWLVYFAF